MRPQSGSEAPPDALIDWTLAASTGAYLVRGGPVVDRSEARRTVTDLRDLTMDAERHVRELTGLGAALPLLPADVVDRPGWVRAAAAGLDRLTSRIPPGRNPATVERGAFGSVLAGGAGVQTGVVLAFLGSRVLGQYDPFGGPDHAGRLLLVAPNVMAAQQAMRVAGRDFRMWVCLHECTHRLQFTAVDWLRDYFAEEVSRLVAGLTETDGLAAVLSRLSRNPGELRRAREDGSVGLAELLQSPSQREVFGRLLALSTLLEGHADYVMDAVGPKVVPSVATIRSRFTARRKGGGPVDRVLRGLLGVDAKVKQYALGAKFTREVVDAVGMAGFNTVWTSPNTLPTRAEISEPSAWLRRIH